VSGGIAAYKVAEFCRLLVRAGATVQVMMTAAARRFVGEITFSALSGRAVSTDLFDPISEANVGHIHLADMSELMVVAPATANIIAKMSQGIADDLVSTVYLAHQAPVLVAPAMNVNMWNHPATQHNVQTLRQRGHLIVGPAKGDLACGYEGAGRMVEPEQLLQGVGWALAPQDLQGKRILITAGPTHEPLDPVRFIGNRSSGRMGFALAAEARARGGEVLLIAGPVALPTPWDVRRLDVVTAQQMSETVLQHSEKQDVVIMAAAVADYRPQSPAQGKLKKEALGEAPALELRRNEDILRRLGQQAGRSLLVGFAAETTEDLDAEAAAKLHSKGCDLIVANNVLAEGAGFEVTTNRVTLYDRQGPQALPLMGKRRVAEKILDRVVQLMAQRSSVGDA
jgi:phosphopantothenoylcysteine decarboxylase/phosphopantothenate--cysteine ligase